MIRRIAQLTAVLLFLSTALSAQNPLFIPTGTSINVDGHRFKNEWKDADSLIIEIDNNREVIVHYKHDKKAFLFLFEGSLESSRSLFPEILLNRDNDKGISWDSNDWWFHVSATDCDYQGAYGVFDSCELERPGWQANNIREDNKITDTIEVRIPFTTFNYEYHVEDTLGMALVLTNTFSAWHFFPEKATSSQPASWSEIVFSNLTPGSLEGDNQHHNFQLYPNPADDYLFIERNQPAGMANVQILQLDGKSIKSFSFDSNKHRMDISELTRGTYFLSINTEGQRQISRFVVL